MKPKHLNVSQRLMREQILLGGEIMTRQEALNDLQRDGVAPGAIDWAVFAPKPLSDEEVWNWRSVELLLVLRWRCLALKGAN